MQTREFLAALRGRLRRLVITDFSARFVAFGFFTLLGFTMLDYLAANAVLPFIPPLPAVLRVVFLLGWLVLMGSLCYRRLLRPLARHLTDTKLANLVERRLPRLDGRVYNRLDGIELDASSQRELETTLDRASLHFLAPGSRLKHSLSTCSLALLIMLGLGLYARQSATTALYRFFAPFGSVEWPTSTIIQGDLDRPVVASDEPLVVDLELTEQSEPARVTLDWTGEDGITDSRRLESLTGPWREMLHLRRGRYRLVAASGKKSNRLVLEGMVVPRPDIASMRVRVVPPAYLTGPGIIEPTVNSSLAAQAVIPGTRFEFELDLDLDPDRAAEHVAVSLDGEAVDYRNGGTRLTGSFRVLEDSELFVDLAAIYEFRQEKHYFDERPSEPVVRRYRIGTEDEKRFKIMVKQDLPPSVQVAGVERNEAVVPSARLELLINASDDFALEKLDLRYQILDGEDEPLFEEMRVVHTFAAVTGLDSTRRKYPLAVAALTGPDGKVVPGRSIELIVRAEDGNDVTGPGVSHSDPLRLRVVTLDQLRAELGNVLHDAYERINQTRESVAKGLADPDDLRQQCRSARIAARRGGDLLDEAERRWRQNGLDDKRLADLSRAAALVRERGRPALTAAGYGEEAEAEDQAREADEALGEAERILSKFLRNDDLVRNLRNLTNRQQAMHEETRGLLKRMLKDGLDEADQKRLDDLVERQGELAKRLKQWERKLLEDGSDTLDKMQETVREEQPADRLDSAARSLADKRVQAQSQQAEALSTMRKLLQQFQGSDLDRDLAMELGELAAAEEDLRDRLEDGERPEDLADEQKDLNEALEDLLDQVPEDEDHQTARDLLDAARRAQDQAGEQMRQGNRSGASRNAGAAAGLMRQAQQELDPDQQQDQQGQEDQDDDEEMTQEDVVALLRELRDMQRKVVAGAILQEARMVKVRQQAGRAADDDKLSFAERRRVQELAQQERDVRLRLREQGIKSLESDERFRIALHALKRVDGAVNGACEHLETPALGARGVRLTKIALYEIERLLAIVDGIPPPGKSDEEGGGGSGQEGGGRKAPFPPRAQLGLLRAEQEGLARLLPTSLPADLLARQIEVLRLTDWVMRQTRPGTRPDVLMQRAFRAMSSAAYDLGRRKRGTVARNEMDAAIAALTRLLEEAKQNGGSGSGKNNQQQQNRKRQQGRSRGQKGDEKRNGQGQAAGGNAAGGNAAEADGEAQVAGTNQEERGRFMHLPKTARERLQEALRSTLPPSVKKRFQTYLEFLEDLE